MPSGGQLRLAQAIRRDNKSRKEDAKNAESQMKKQGVFGGWGRGLLGLAGGLLAGPAGAGIGSWLGTKGGEALAGEVEDARDTDFGIGATEDLNDSISGYRRNANTMAVGRGITDAFSAYVAPEMLNKIKAKFGNAGTLPTNVDIPNIENVEIPNIYNKFNNNTLSGTPMSTSTSSSANTFKPSMTDEELSKIIQGNTNKNLTAINTSTSSNYNPQTGGGSTAIESTATPRNNMKTGVGYGDKFLNSITNNQYSAVNPLTQAVQTNAPPYLQKTASYISPEARRQMLLRGLIDRNRTGGR